MKIVVFGATSKTGSLLLEQALAKGHIIKDIRTKNQEPRQVLYIN
jgi:uncharacterized protein YbjT (DUF2867 family)